MLDLNFNLWPIVATIGQEVFGGGLLGGGQWWCSCASRWRGLVVDVLFVFVFASLVDLRREREREREL